MSCNNETSKSLTPSQKEIINLKKKFIDLKKESTSLISDYKNTKCKLDNLSIKLKTAEDKLFKEKIQNEKANLEINNLKNKIVDLELLNKFKLNDKVFSLCTDNNWYPCIIKSINIKQDNSESEIRLFKCEFSSPRDYSNNKLFYVKQRNLFLAEELKLNNSLKYYAKETNSYNQAKFQMFNKESGRFVIAIDGINKEIAFNQAAIFSEDYNSFSNKMTTCSVSKENIPKQSKIEESNDLARIKTIAKFISNNLNSVKSDKSTQLANNNSQIKLFSGVKLVPLDLSKYDLKRLG